MPHRDLFTQVPFLRLLGPDYPDLAWLREWAVIGGRLVSNAQGAVATAGSDTMAGSRTVNVEPWP